MVLQSNGDRSHGRKVRYAVVGLGYISQIAMLPAFEHAKANSELVAFVSDDDVKIDELKRRYGVKNACSYGQYDRLLQSQLIDAVYIATPNSLHREFAVKAAEAHVHVLCEKPMASNDFDCLAMLESAKANDIKFMVAYRLHFDEANMKIVDLAQSGKIGELKFFSSSFSMQVKNNNVRTKKALGGGPVNDLGIYCINAARYLFRAEPIEVSAFAIKSDDQRFREIDETVAVIMRFPEDKLGSFTCSFGAADVSRYELIGTKGIITADPAYDYSKPIKFVVTANDRSEHYEFPVRDQFASQLIHFSDCILTGREPVPCAEEGFADVSIIAAINQSLKTGASMPIEKVGLSRRPGPEDVQRHPPVSKPELVHVAAPHD